MKKKNLFKVMSVLSPIFVSMVFSVHVNAGLIKEDPITGLTSPLSVNSGKNELSSTTPSNIHKDVLKNSKNDMQNSLSEMKLDSQNIIKTTGIQIELPKPEIQLDIKSINLDPTSLPKQEVLVESQKLADLIEGTTEQAQPVVNLEDQQEQPVVNLEDQQEQPVVNLEDQQAQPVVNLEDQQEQPVVNLEDQQAQPVVNLEDQQEQPVANLEDQQEQPVVNLEDQQEQPTVLVTPAQKPVAIMEQDTQSPESIAKVISRQIADINMPVNESEALLETATDALSEKTVTQEQIDNIQNELTTLKIQVTDANEIIKSLEKDKEILTETVLTSDAQHKATQKLLSEKEAQLELINTQLTEAEQRSIMSDGDNAITKAELSENKLTIETLTMQRDQLQQDITDTDKLFNEITQDQSKEIELANTQKDEALSQKAEVEKNLKAVEVALNSLKEKIKEKDEVITAKNTTIEENTKKIDELTSKLEKQSEKYDAVIADKKVTDKAFCEIKDYATQLEEEKAVLEQSPVNVAMTRMMEMMTTMMMPMMMNMMAQQGPQVRMHNGIDNNYAQRFLQNNGTARAGLQVQSMHDFFSRTPNAPGATYISVGGDYYAGNYAVDGFNQTTQSRFPTSDRFRNNMNRARTPDQFIQQERPFAFDFNQSVNSGDRFGQLNAQNSLGHQQRVDDMMRGSIAPNRPNLQAPIQTPRQAPGQAPSIQDVEEQFLNDRLQHA